MPRLLRVTSGTVLASLASLSAAANAAASVCGSFMISLVVGLLLMRESSFELFARGVVRGRLGTETCVMQAADRFPRDVATALIVRVAATLQLPAFHERMNRIVGDTQNAGGAMIAHVPVAEIDRHAQTSNSVFGVGIWYLDYLARAI